VVYPHVPALPVTVTDFRLCRFAEPHLVGSPEASLSCKRCYSSAPAAAAQPQFPIAGCDAISPPAPLPNVPDGLTAQWPASSPALSGFYSATVEAFPPTPGSSLAAATSLEDSLALVLSPTQLGVQLWEGAHAATGLPWWAAIPTATFALRGALLPLSLRAYAASANVTLLHQAFGLSRAVAEAVATAARQKQTVHAKQWQQNPSKQPEESSAGVEDGRREQVEGDVQQQTENSSGGGGMVGDRAASSGVIELGRFDLLRRVFSHLRAEHGAPSFGWYVGNAVVQVRSGVRAGAWAIAHRVGWTLACDMAESRILVGAVMAGGGPCVW
jgi:hypothetical protein